jgi:hypothetical protein
VTVDADYYHGLMAPSYAGRRWMLAFDAVAGTTRGVAGLRRYGSDRVFVLAATVGTGDLPDGADAEWAVLGSGGEGIMGSIRAYLRALDAVPDDIVARIDAWDPDRTARVITAPFDVARRIAGRPTYGTRPAAWAALEDKTIVDDLWEAAGVPHAPAEVVAADRDRLEAAASRLDTGSGTVWVGDNREGWHGGAEYLRVVTDEGPAAGAVEFFVAHCSVVRVMPFLDGVPCSIHGMVVGDDVLAFRPVEMVVFRRPDSDRLHYASTATFWDPPDADREEMRAAVRRVGRLLVDRVGYRGVFTIDGVMTADGFRPTELNPRFGVGLATVVRGGDLPVGGIHRALVEGEDLEYRPAELERLVVETGDGVRAGGGFTLVTPHQGENRTLEVVFGDGRCREAGEGETPDATMLLGPATGGGALRVTLDPDRTPKGPSVGARVAAAFAFADEVWGTGIGPLVPAAEVR